jgi:hypothetical protein
MHPPVARGTVLSRGIAMLCRRPVALTLTAAILAGCSIVQPNPDCGIGERCDAVLSAARSIVPFDGARVVVVWGRGPVFHAEVHVCYSDGRNALVDVMGDDLNAGLRDTTWDSPPCR